MLNCFGFKIVEKSCPSIEPLVERALREGRPLEVGLYYNDPEALDYLAHRLPASRAPVVAHLNFYSGPHPLPGSRRAFARAVSKA